MSKFSIGLIASALLLPAALCAQPAAYPNRPITMIVSVSAGGSIDTIARALAEEMARGLGRPIAVENRPGANGNLAATAVARAQADGHTLLVTGGSTLNLNPHLYRKLPFDPEKDLAPITLTARTNLILVVHPKHNVDSVEGLIALARAQPGKLNYGSAGNGSLMHIATELFNSAAGVDTRHIPYKGLAPAVTDILAGNIDFMFDSATTVGHIKAGKLKALAVVGPNPLPALPQLKVLASHGIRDVEVASGWHRLFAPAIVEQRRLAAARGPENRGEFVRRHRQFDVLQRERAALALGNPLPTERSSNRHPRARSRGPTSRRSLRRRSDSPLPAFSCKIIFPSPGW